MKSNFTGNLLTGGKEEKAERICKILWSLASIVDNKTSIATRNTKSQLLHKMVFYIQRIEKEKT